MLSISFVNEIPTVARERGFSYHPRLTTSRTSSAVCPSSPSAAPGCASSHCAHTGCTGLTAYTSIVSQSSGGPNPSHCRWTTDIQDAVAAFFSKCADPSGLAQIEAARIVDKKKLCSLLRKIRFTIASGHHTSVFVPCAVILARPSLQNSKSPAADARNASATIAMNARFHLSLALVHGRIHSVIIVNVQIFWCPSLFASNTSTSFNVIRLLDFLTLEVLSRVHGHFPNLFGVPL